MEIHTNQRGQKTQNFKKSKLSKNDKYQLLKKIFNKLHLLSKELLDKPRKSNCSQKSSK